MITEIATRRPKTILFLFAAVTVVAALGTMRLDKEEDLLVFLPSTDKDVQRFKDVSRTFGALRVGLVGVEAPEGQDLFKKETLARVSKASDALRNLHGVENVVSLTRVEDVVASPEGAKLRQLVERIPENQAEEKALRELVLSRDHIVGSLVSKDGRAALIMVFLVEGARDREVTEAIRRTTAKELAGLSVYHGGAPFAAIDIYDEAQKDVWSLSPVALLVLLLVVVLSFRDPVGVALTIGSVGLATLWVMGGMGFIHDKFTVATSTMPVILFASGSCYAVNLLGRYYMASKDNPRGAVEDAVGTVGAPLAMAAFTAAAGFLSFLVTDVAPMRNFGIACGVGVLLCWLTSVTLIPAVLTLWPRKAVAHAQLARLGDWLVSLWNWSRRRRLVIVAVSVVVAAACLRPMTRVPVRMEPSAFFRVGSEPWKAAHFLTERFGGGTFITVAMHGDLDDPRTLREIARFEDYARSLSGVSQVQSVLAYLRLTNDAMGSGKTLPRSGGQAGNLYSFLQGKAGVSTLISQDRRNALVNIRVRDHARAVTEALEQFAVRGKPADPARDDIADRVAWIAQGDGRTPDVPRLRNALKIVAMPGDLDEGWTARRKEVLREFLASDDALILADDEKKQLEQLVAENPPDLGPVLAKCSSESKIAVDNLTQRLGDARQDLGASRALPLALEAAAIPADSDSVKLVRQALDDLFVKLDGGPAQAGLTVQVAGEPVLERGFSRSVGQTLDNSLTVSRIAVFLFLLVLFRSFKMAIVCMLPSTLTVFILFGIMGALGVSIDLGTSLVAGIATGAGADFTLYYLWYLRRQSAEEVSRGMGPIMVVSIVLVSLGFVVLALGKSPVMHLFGTLAGVSMALAALLTCLLVPALLTKLGVEMPQVPSKSQEGSP